MKLEIKPENFLFRYWMDIEIPKIKDDITLHMDRVDWTRQLCGSIGTNWGFDKLENPETKIITYSYRFKNQKDALMFKLKWHT